MEGRSSFAAGAEPEDVEDDFDADVKAGDVPMDSEVFREAAPPLLDAKALVASSSNSVLPTAAAAGQPFPCYSTLCLDYDDLHAASVAALPLIRRSPKGFAEHIPGMFTSTAP